MKPSVPVRPASEHIAVVGIGLRLPGGAESPDELWSLLMEGVDCMRPIPGNRWDVRRFHDPDLAAIGKHRIREAGFLHGSLYDLDASFFGFSPREAEVLDPRQWLMLESAWEALEDAGIRPSSVAGSDTAVFVSSFLEDSTIHRMDPLALSNLDGNVSRASSQTMLSARLSHFFDLRGPSLALDTACSGSLVATHLGCQAIRAGECTRALVGGVNLILRPEPMVVLDKGGFLNPESRCRTFDERAAGYARGEGAAVVVLEPLDKAREAGRRIYAVICASGCNQDGHTPGITVPSLEAQTDLIRGLCEYSGVPAASVDFVEAHGTGTPVGDPIEVRALQAVMGSDRRAERPCLMGSIKTNLGHLEAAAGVAGLVKACLCLRHGRVAPSIHFERLNPAIDLSSGTLQVATEPTALEGRGPFHAVVNSFGYGGTNAALLLRSEPPTTVTPPQARPGPAVVPISARSERSLRALADRYANWLTEHPDLSPRSMADSAHHTRDAHRYRAAVVATSSAQLVDRLREVARADKGAGSTVGMLEGPPEAPVFTYTGMGAQSWGMGRELLDSDPTARGALGECAEIYGDLTGQKLLERFDAGSPRFREHPPGSPMLHPEDAQPANLALQVALTRTWREIGLEPGAVVGHSVGEIAAAWAAGLLSLEDAFLIITTRSELFGRLEGRGTMLAVQGEVASLAPLLERPDLDVCVATVNGPRICVASGPRAGLEALVPSLQERGARCTFLPVAVPYHHHYIRPYAEEFRERTSSVSTGEQRTPFYSTVTGSASSSISAGPEHWWRACVEPARLDLAVDALRRDGHRVYLEIGPHPNVGPAVAEAYLAAGSRAVVLHSLRRGRPDLESLAETRAQLWVRGAWKPRLTADGARPPLPKYAWHRERHYSVTEGTQRHLFGTNEHPLLQVRQLGPSLAWRSELTGAYLPFLPDHRLAGEVVFPGTGYLEAALAAARSLGDAPWEVLNLQLHSILVPSDRPKVHVSVEQDGGYFAFASAAFSDETSWLTHASGRIVRGGVEPAADSIDLAEIRARCTERVDPDFFYEDIERVGFGYGPGFQVIQTIQRGSAELLAELDTSFDTSEYIAHPALLDGAVQTIFAMREDPSDDTPLLPVSFRRLRLRAPLGARVWAWARLESRGPNHLIGRILLADADGAVLAELAGVRYRRVRSDDIITRATRLYHHVWEAAEPAARSVESPTHWVLLEQQPGVAAELAQALEARQCVARVHPLEAFEPSRIRGDQALVIVLRSQLGAVLGPTALEAHLDPRGEVTHRAIVGLSRAACAADNPPARLILLSDRAFRVVEGDLPVDPGQRALWGLLRVLPNEVPALRCRRIDGAGASAESIVDELLAATDEDEVALRPAGRFLHRLVATRGADQGLPVMLDGCLPMHLRGSATSVGGVEFVEGEHAELGPDEVRCRVKYAGLNFKDVLKAQHRLPEEYMSRTYSGQAFGSEFVGEVVDAGTEVRGFAHGDLVYGFAHGTMATFVQRRLSSILQGVRKWAPLVFPVPEGRKPEDFVSYVNYVTAWHCLVRLAHVEEGETVLVHSATGGVGLAALQIARLRGARVLATAGSEEKRSHLRDLGVEWIGDSRSLGFADEVLRHTGGRGVDVVLGAAPGEAVVRNLEVLAPFGRYVDIGKADILRGSRLGLDALDNNRSFIAFDLDLAEGELSLYRSMLDVVGALERGDLQPLPTKFFPASRIEDAVRYLGRGKHIGKVAVDMGEACIPAIRRPGAPTIGDGTVLIIGGLGRLGLALSRWLIERGERHLALVGRSGAADFETAEAVDRLRRRADVQVYARDATDRDAMAAMLREIRATGRPLRSVYHLASIWDDQFLAAQSQESFSRVYDVKVKPAVLLHELTADDPVSDFVLFSSVSAILGNPGQAAYAAANAFLDGLAHHRRALGLPAIAVDLGLVGDVGVAADDAVLTQMLVARGLEPLAFAEALERLGCLLEDRPVQCAIAGFDWQRLQSNWRLTPRYQHLLVAEGGRGVSGRSAGVQAALDDLLEAGPAQRKKSAIRLTVLVVAELIGVDPERLDPDSSLMDMGLDSLMAVELGALISETTGVQFGTEMITSGASLRECARTIAEQLER